MIYYFIQLSLITFVGVFDCPHLEDRRAQTTSEVLEGESDSFSYPNVLRDILSKMWWRWVGASIWRYVYVMKTFNNYFNFVFLCIEGILN